MYFQTHSAHNKGVSYSQETKERIRQSALKAGVGRWNRGRVLYYFWLFFLQVSPLISYAILPPFHPNKINFT
jgi:hypothetical protein